MGLSNYSATLHNYYLVICFYLIPFSYKVFTPSINLLSEAGLDIRKLEQARAKEWAEIQVQNLISIINNIIIRPTID